MKEETTEDSSVTLGVVIGGSWTRVSDTDSSHTVSSAGPLRRVTSPEPRPFQKTFHTINSQIRPLTSYSSSIRSLYLTPTPPLEVRPPHVDVCGTRLGSFSCHNSTTRDPLFDLPRVPVDTGRGPEPCLTTS